MNPITSASSKEVPRRLLGSIAICNADPERLLHWSRRFPAVAAGGDVLLAADCGEAIRAALEGRVQAVVVGGGRLSLGALTALSFLQEALPELAVYILSEEEGEPRLARWVPPALGGGAPRDPGLTPRDGAAPVP